MKSIQYVELTDRRHRGELVRREGRKCYEFEEGKWVESTIMIGYLWPDSPEFGMYKEISEGEALKKLGIEA